jgi:hypothetical protein
MRNWAFNILINASKKNARRRERFFKYCQDIHVDNGIVRFQSTSTPTRVYDIEAQAFTYVESHSGRIVYEDLNPELDDEYEPIDYYM